MLLLLLVHLLLALVAGRTWDLQVDGGAVPDDESDDTAWKNGAALNATLAKLQPGDTLLVPNRTFHTMGGVISRNLVDATLNINGTLVFSKNMKAWPRTGPGDDASVLECLYFFNATRLTVTSSGQGLLDGNGPTWWGLPGVGYLEIGENRPRLLHIEDSHDVLVERISFVRPPYWTVYVNGVDGLEVRYCSVDAWRTSHDKHTGIDLTAFNTDGFDVTGTNIHIHHSQVWNQDDCFDVKDGTSNVLIEHIEASGLGLTIGSIASTVRNVTFRHAHMRHTYKGIYLKFRGAGVIEDILYENITMDEPEQYPIWIGPAQQSDDKHNPCAAHPCSLCWPTVPLAQCNAPPAAYYRNVTLRNITINSPAGGDNGLIFANSTSPMVNVTFENVVINNPSTKHHSWGTGYFCQGVQGGVATGTTSPVPSCFTDRTDRALAAEAARRVVEQAA